MLNEIHIKEILGLDENFSGLSRSHNLDEYTWDSMAMIMLQTHIDSEFNIQIDPDNLPELKTIGCLDDFISSFK